MACDLTHPDLGQEKRCAPVGGEAEAIVGVIAAAPGAIAPGAMAEGDTVPIWDWGICMGHAKGPLRTPTAGQQLLNVFCAMLMQF